MRRRSGKASRKRRAARWGSRGLWALLTGAGLLTLLATVFPASSYALDLLAHFAPHAILLGLLSLPASLAWKGRLPLALSGTITLLLLALVLVRYQAFAPGGAGDAPTRTVRVAVYNAFARGATRTGSELDDVFREWLIDSGADLVCVVDPPWHIRRSGLWPGEPFLPHVVERMTAHGRHTITLLSRWPVRLEPLTESDDPRYRLSFAAYSSVIVEFPAGGEALFTAAHPRSPRNKRAWELSERWSKVDAELLRAWRDDNDLPVIFAGDFNTTPTGRLHALIARETGLRSPTRPFTQGSWPASAPTFLALPIDRVYVTPDIRVTRATVGPRVYSDHRPVLFELEIPVVSGSGPEGDKAQNPQ